MAKGERTKVKLALQKPMDYSLKRLMQMSGHEVIAEPKKDGLRGVIIVDEKGRASAYTSHGIPVVNAAHICRAIEHSDAFDGTVLDFEYYTDDWNLTQSLVMTQAEHPRADELHIHVFECVSLAAFQSKHDVTSLRDRKMRLKDRLRIFKRYFNLSDRRSQKIGRLVAQMPYQILPKKEDVLFKFFNKCVADGHEGAVFKDLSSPYAFKRHRSWLRMKPVKDFDAKIVGVKEEKSKEGKLKGRLGALYVEGKIGKIKIKTKVGSGYNAQDRVSLWKEHKKGKLIGRIVEVHYDNITVNNALRFARFERMRPDK